MPAVALYMSFFYHRRAMGLRFGFFVSFSPLASCFVSALAYGIIHADAGIENWQLLFIVGELSPFPIQTMLLLPPELAVRMSFPNRTSKSHHQPASHPRPR